MQDTIKEALVNIIGSEPIDKNQSYFTKLFVKIEDLTKLLNIWNRWHLNDLNAGCEHQRALLAPENVAYPNHEYNELMKWAPFQKCPQCGYAYGSKWLFEKLPDDVVEFVKKFVAENA